MNKEIKKILEEFENLFEVSEAPEHIIKDFNKIKDYITNLEEENERLKELCDKYEEEHNTTFKEWQKDIKTNLVEKVDD